MQQRYISITSYIHILYFTFSNTFQFKLVGGTSFVENQIKLFA